MSSTKRAASSWSSRGGTGEPLESPRFVSGLSTDGNGGLWIAERGVQAIEIDKYRQQLGTAQTVQILVDGEAVRNAALGECGRVRCTASTSWELVAS